MIDIIAFPYETRCGQRWKVDFSFKSQAGIVDRIQMRGFTSKGDAVQAGEAEYSMRKSGQKIKVKQDKPGPEAKPKTTEFVLLFMVDRWEKKGLIKPSSAQSYRKAVKNYIIPFVGNVNWKDLKERHLDAIAEVTAKLKMPMHLYVLKRAIAESKRAGFPPPNLEIELPRTVREPRLRFIGIQELDQLCAVSGEKWAAVWRLMFYTGIRRGELQGLQWNDWDARSAHPTLTVRRTLASSDKGPLLQSTKSGRVRVIPLCEQAQAALKVLLFLRRGSVVAPAEKDPLHHQQILSGLGKKFLSTTSLVSALTSASKRAHLEKVYPHVFRHSFASMLVQNGVSLQAVATLLGHTSITTTMIYAHLSPEGLRSSVGTLDQLSSRPAAATGDEPVGISTVA